MLYDMKIFNLCSQERDNGGVMRDKELWDKIYYLKFNFLVFLSSFVLKHAINVTIVRFVHCKNFNFLIPISLQLDGVNLWYFKVRLFDLTELIVWNI